MNWRQLTQRERATFFPDLCTSIFGEWNRSMRSRNVFVNDAFTGFVSGYLIDRETFYISWAGSNKGFAAGRRAYLDWESNLKNSGVKWITGKIENTNTKTQRLIMGMGWIPRGIITSGNRIYIDYYKEL